MNQQYRIRVKTDHREIEIESSEKTFVEEKFNALSKQLNMLSSTNAMQGSYTSGKKESLNEFLGRVKPKSATEYTISIAYFLEKMEGLTEIAFKDIKEGFRRAKFPHSNPSQALIDAKTQGLLMGDSLKHCIITGKGEKWIEGRISGNSSEISK